MNTPNIASTQAASPRPQDIMKVKHQKDGFSSIILNMFHIGNPAVKAAPSWAHYLQ
jgi:hypothetical protein